MTYYAINPIRNKRCETNYLFWAINWIECITYRVNELIRVTILLRWKYIQDDINQYYRPDYGE